MRLTTTDRPMRNRTVLLLLATAMAAVSAASAAHAADPTAADCFAANEKSIALKAAGKFREARTQLALCQFHSCPADVRAVCERRLDTVNDAIPTVIFDVKD